MLIDSEDQKEEISVFEKIIEKTLSSLSERADFDQELINKVRSTYKAGKLNKPENVIEMFEMVESDKP